MVVAMVDPNPLVDSAGLALLRAAGVRVDVFPEDAPEARAPTLRPPAPLPPSPTVSPFTP